MAIKRWNILRRLISANGYRTVVEIGVHRGRNMQEVLTKQKEVLWYAVDPWEFTKSYPCWGQSLHDASYKRFLIEKAKFPGRVEELRMSSASAVDLIPDGIDLLFIDGDHEYSAVKRDIELYVPKVRSGGIVSGHDYNNLPRFPGVKQAVDEVFRTVTRAADHVWWVKV